MYIQLLKGEKPQEFWTEQSSIGKTDKRITPIDAYSLPCLTAKTIKLQHWKTQCFGSYLNRRCNKGLAPCTPLVSIGEYRSDIIVL
jgi:hypothetical protein